MDMAEVLVIIIGRGWNCTRGRASVQGRESSLFIVAIMDLSAKLPVFVDNKLLSCLESYLQDLQHMHLPLCSVCHKTFEEDIFELASGPSSPMRPVCIQSISK